MIRFGRTVLGFAAAGAMLASAVAPAEAAVIAGPPVPATSGGMGNGGPVSLQVMGDIQYQHRNGFQGAKRVAISVFNVAFPDENVQKASASETYKFGSYSALGTKMLNTVHNTKTAYQHTLIQGVDNATRQRIADTAYADFVADLTKAGYEVVGADELEKLAPEYATWASVPNFSQGRFGAYVAPTGRKVFWMMGDNARRDPSGQFAQEMNAFSMASRTQAYTRSPYLAAAGGIGVIAVTLVIDYGTYKNTGESKHYNRKVEVSFSPGVVAQAGSGADSATLAEYWGPKSGGFPAVAFMLTPLVSDQDFGAIDDGGNGEGEVLVKASGARFENAAVEVAKAANDKLISAMAAAR